MAGLASPRYLSEYGFRNSEGRAITRQKGFWCDIASDPEHVTETADPTKQPLPVVLFLVQNPGFLVSIT
jgi:hypothetical protein